MRAASLSQALISFKGQTVATDAQGHFSLVYESKDLPTNILVSHPGYEELPYELNTSTSNTPLTLTLHPVESPSPTTAPTVEDVGTGTKVAATTPPPEKEIIPARYFDLVLASVLFLPSAIFLVWWLLRLYRRRRMQLKKRDARSERQVDELLVKSFVEKFFQGAAFRRIAQELRRHRRYGSNDIDVQPTVNATIRQGGWFMPVYGTRLEQPEYLALIDRASFSDQQAHLEDELIKRLVKDNVLVERFYFHEDPLICRRENPNEPYLDLQDLSARYPNHNLLIFSDGATFINPFTGQPQSWLDLMTSWQVHALLTPEAPTHWGYREWALSNQDFIVVPASKAGMTALVEIIGTGQAPSMNSRFGAQPFPEMLRERPLRWVEKHEPERDTINRLCFQLRRYLGDDGYYLLGACAIYPQLNWDLTLYLASQLCEKDTLEENLRALVRLPWFRHGSMPNWLRLRLISALPQKREESVRQALTDLLLSSTLKAPERRIFSLPFVKRKSLFWELVKSEPQESPLREHVFLNFMSGYKSGKLAVPLPDAVRRIVYPQGQKPLGVRPSIALLLALFFSSAGLIGIAYTQQKTPSIEAVEIPNLDPVPPPIPDSSYTFTPTGGSPGKQYQLTVKSSDCELSNLKGATINSPGNSGISIDSVSSDDCQLIATVTIAPNAPSGIVPLHIVTGDSKVDIEFTVTPPACPRVIINCPQPLDTEAMFTASIIGGVPNTKVVYNWTVSTGTIVSGQGTASIFVVRQVTPSPLIRSVTASVEVTGYDAVCPMSASCSSAVAECPPHGSVVPGSKVFDSFGSFGMDDEGEMARLDNFAIELRNNPQTQGYLVYFNGGADRATFAMNYLMNTRGIERNRIRIVPGGRCSGILIELDIGPLNTTPADQESKRTNVRQDWVTVETQLMYRVDLVLNLIETLKAAGVNDQKLFGTLSQARSKVLNAINAPPLGVNGDKTPEQRQAVIDAFNEFDTSLDDVLSLEASYPQLKISATYQNLLDQFLKIDSRIIGAGYDYNQAAQDYNATRDSNPAEPLWSVSRERRRGR
jgi:hypothetical protein